MIPNEWNILDAYIEDKVGNKIINFKENNLHVVNYSIPIDKLMSFEELKSHIHYLPNMPEAIPYRTSYYKRDWGFCLSYNDFCKLKKDEEYHIVINSTLKPGSLTYGEYIINGNSGKEFIFSSYCCHPSLGNDNLSGMVLWILLLKILKKSKLNHTYRFVLVPETIGAIAYLSKNENKMREVDGGFVLTCVGGPNKFEYKPTFLENSIIDKIVDESFKETGIDYVKYPFDVNGSDETSYSAPYFRIPIGTICRDKYYEFEFYHTSLDNLEFIQAKSIIETLEMYLQIISKLEKTNTFDEQTEKHGIKKGEFKKNTLKSLNPFCEPMLSKRNLYPSVGGQISQKAVNLEKKHRSRNYSDNNKQAFAAKDIDAISWLMFYADDVTTLKEISKKSGLTEELLEKTINVLTEHNLIKVNE